MLCAAVSFIILNVYLSEHYLGHCLIASRRKYNLSLKQTIQLSPPNVEYQVSDWIYHLSWLSAIYRSQDDQIEIFIFIIIIKGKEKEDHLDIFIETNLVHWAATLEPWQRR